MNPFVFVMRRPVKTLMLVVALVSVGVLGCSKMGVDFFPPLNTPKIHVYLDYIGTTAMQVKEYIVARYESYFHKHKEEEEAHQEHHKIVATSPKAKDVIITQDYVCQIHSQRHINVRALENGFLVGIPLKDGKKGEMTFLKEGQEVKKDEVMFQIIPTLYKAKLDAEAAEAEFARLKLTNTKQLFADRNRIVSQNEVLLSKPNWQGPRPRGSWRRPN